MIGLTPDQGAAVHSAAENLLEHTGFEVRHPGLLRLAAQAGARVDEPGGRVRVPPALLRELIGRAPARYAIAGATGREWQVGSKDQHCVAIVTDPWILDYQTQQGRRPCLADVRRHTRVAQRLDEVAAISLMDYPVEDVHGASSNLRAMEEHLLNHGKHIYVLPTSVESLDRWLRLGRVLLNGRELRGSRLMTVGVAVLSPLTLTGMNGELLLRACEHDLPVVPTICPMAGTTAPYSKAGILLLGHAEALFMAALTQMVRPGHPFIYVQGLSRTDLRTGEDLYYTLDKVLWKLASVQLGKACGLPTAAECGGTMSPRYDLQAGAESALFMLSAAQSGADLLSGIGSCYNAVGMSPEMMVVQSAWLCAARFMQAGIDTSTHLGLESIAQAGPGGHFLEDPMTVELMRGDEFFGCDLFDYEWGQDRPALLDRAHQRVEELAADSASPLPEPVQEELRRFFGQERTRLADKA